MKTDVLLGKVLRCGGVVWCGDEDVTWTVGCVRKLLFAPGSAGWPVSDSARFRACCRECRLVLGHRPHAPLYICYSCLDVPCIQLAMTQLEVEKCCCAFFKLRRQKKKRKTAQSNQTVGQKRNFPCCQASLKVRMCGTHAGQRVWEECKSQDKESAH